MKNDHASSSHDKTENEEKNEDMDTIEPSSNEEKKTINEETVNGNTEEREESESSNKSDD